MATQQQLAQTAPAPHEDFMPLNGIDHVEMWVGNALHATYFLTRAYGFTEVAYQGLETGVRDHVSHVLEQGRIRFVLGRGEELPFAMRELDAPGPKKRIGSEAASLVVEDQPRAPNSPAQSSL